jgi:hypothetical protein
MIWCYIYTAESEAAQSSTSSIVSELSAREQAVLERIIGSNHEAILDGHKFAKQLAKELDTLGKVWRLIGRLRKGLGAIGQFVRIQM